LDDTKFDAIPQSSSKTGKQGRNKGSTKLYCLFIADDSIVDVLSFIGHIVHIIPGNLNAEKRFRYQIYQLPAFICAQLPAN